MHLWTQSPLLKALGWALLDSLWQMAFLWLLYFLLVFLFSHLSAAVRHGLALMLVSLGACWAVATFFAAWRLPDQDHLITGIWLNVLPAIREGRLWQLSRGFTDEILIDGSLIYLLVSGGLLTRYLYQYRQSGQLTRQGLSKLPPALRVFVSATSHRMGIRSTVSAWLSSRVDVPLTLGHLKPVILLPVAMVSHLTPQQVEAIIVHELAHIRRHDYLLHLIVTVLEGLFFFNPFARLLIGQVKKERENCCDDLVLQFRYDPHSYVSALLSLATRSQKVQGAIAATGDGDRLLLQRAKRILQQQKRSDDRPGLRPIVLLSLTLLMTLMTVYPPAHPVATRQPSQVVITRTVHRRVSGIPAPAAVPVVRPTLLANAVAVVTVTSLPAKTVTVRLHRRRMAEARIDADPDDMTGNNIVALIHTADDEASAPSAAVPSDQSPQDATPREYSIRLTPPDAIPGRIKQLRGTPFVPDVSFSYQFTTGNGADTAEQLQYLQQSTRTEILTAMNNLHRQFEEQLQALTAQEERAGESLPLRRQLRSQELKLQQLYLKKISEWEKRLEKTGHLKMIVYI